MTYLAPPPDPPNRPAPLNAFARILWDLAAVLGARTRPVGHAPVGHAPVGHAPLGHAPVGDTPMLPPPLVALIAERLIRLRVRFLTLAEQALAGTLKPVRRPAARAMAVAADAARDRDATDARQSPEPAGARDLLPQAARDLLPRAARDLLPRAARDLLPRGKGWLARLCPPVDALPQRQIAPVVEAMGRLLEDETLRALLASDARFGRTLRPLWRMLRTDEPPACLRLPPRTPRTSGTPRTSETSGTPRTSGTPAAPPRVKIPRGVTRRDLRRSRAMALPPPPQPPPWATMTDWTPTHLTLGRRWSVFDPIAPRPPDRYGRV